QGAARAGPRRLRAGPRPSARAPAAGWDPRRPWERPARCVPPGRRPQEGAWTRKPRRRRHRRALAPMTEGATARATARGRGRSRWVRFFLRAMTTSGTGAVFRLLSVAGHVEPLIGERCPAGGQAEGASVSSRRGAGRLTMDAGAALVGLRVWLPVSNRRARRTAGPISLR